MTERRNVKIISIVGLSGSGKSSATEYLTGLGYPKVHFGRVILNALRDEGLEPTLENEKMMRDRLREQEGSDVVVNRIVRQIDDLIDAGQHRIIADGLGSWAAYRVLKHEYPGELTTIALIAPKRLRHSRLNERPQRPLTNAEADQRDYDEIETLNKGGVIAMADYFIANDSSLEKLHTRLDEVRRDIKF